MGLPSVMITITLLLGGGKFLYQKSLQTKKIKRFKTETFDNTSDNNSTIDASFGEPSQPSQYQRQL